MEVRVLVVDPAKRFPASLPDAFRERSSPIRADLSLQPSRALRTLGRDGYDVVVTSAEDEHELALVSRIRRAHADLPVLVVTSDPESPLGARAVEAGATAVLPRKAQFQEMLETLELAVRVSAGIRKNRDVARRTRRMAEEIGRLSDELRGRTHEALARVGKASTACVPLLVDDDAAAVREFRAAFAELDPSIPFQALPSAAEARAYLEGLGAGHPLRPSILLLDLRAPGKPFALLDWLAARPERVWVVAFAADAGARAQALSCGAHDCPPKPGTPAGLLRLARRLRDLDAQ